MAENKKPSNKAKDVEKIATNEGQELDEETLDQVSGGTEANKKVVEDIKQMSNILKTLNETTMDTIKNFR